MKDQTHLSEIQSKDLRHLFETHKALFDGTLGVYPHKKFHIEIDKDEQPEHSHPYAVPHVLSVCPQQNTGPLDGHYSVKNDARKNPARLLHKKLILYAVAWPDLLLASTFW